MKGLTDRQQQVLDFIRSEIDTVGRPPTQHEIKDHFGWASTNAVRTHLRLLEDKGELTYAKHQARGIRLKAEPRGREVRDLPLVGQVPAGTAYGGHRKRRGRRRCRPRTVSRRQPLCLEG